LLISPGPLRRKMTEIQSSCQAQAYRQVWAPTATGLVDPRPAVMRGIRDAMDRIYEHGEVFIVFAAARYEPGCIVGAIGRFDNLDLYAARPLGAHNWSLLSELSSLVVTRDDGQEMDASDNGIARHLGIESYFSSGRFECVVSPSPSLVSRWITLAASKYGDPVAGIIVPGEEEGKGLILILPQVERRADLVADLVDRVLPGLRPQLFPHAEASRWTRRPEYELPYVQVLKNEIVQIEEGARVKIREREEQVAAERAQHGFMHDLLTAADDLVQAVISALKAVGFSDVRDADADLKAAGEVGSMREDVRIMDAAVPVLVEIKGLRGKPTEANSLQVTKYLIPRMREWGRTDLHGLAIVNHQRNIPALERDHDHVFQADVLSNAEDQGFGLLTTWDLSVSYAATLRTAGGTTTWLASSYPPAASGLCQRTTSPSVWSTGTGSKRRHSDFACSAACCESVTVWPTSCRSTSSKSLSRPCRSATRK
jgi:hypothetical protein